MEIDIIDFNEYVKDMKLEEITSTYLYTKEKERAPHPKGLVSYEIFGEPGTPERKTRFAYIDLGEPFVHPHVLRDLSFIPGGKIARSTIDGDTYVYIDSTGALIPIGEDEDPPNGQKKGIGSQFLYDNFDDIDYGAHSRKLKGSASPRRKSRLKMINSLKRDEFFLSKVLVIPPFYRDVDIKNNKNNEINSLYNRLIALSTMLKNQMLRLSPVTQVHTKINFVLTQLCQFFLGKTGGNKGFVHKYVMGKATDFSARLVLSAPSFNTDRPENASVSFQRSAIPLSAFLKCFQPFIAHGVKEFIEQTIKGRRYVYKVLPGGRLKQYELEPSWEKIFSPDSIYHLIDVYHTSKEHRLDLFTIPTVEGEELAPCYIPDDNQIYDMTSPPEASEILKNAEPLRLITLFYMVAMNLTVEPNVYVTRHPIEDHNNIYPCKTNIIPCVNFERRNIAGIEYPRFPVIEYKRDIQRIDSIFVDTFQIFPPNLKALGGDYDGDMVNIQGVFSKEAIADGDYFMNSVANVVNVKGSTMRAFDDVVSHTLYNLTLKK